MYRALLRDRDFRYYFSGRTISACGDLVAMIGYLFVAYKITGSGAETGGVAIAEALPYMLLGIFGGGLSSRNSAMRIMIGIDAMRGAIQVGTFALYVTGTLSYPLLLVIIAAIQLGGVFFNPMSRTILPLVVKAGELGAANAVCELSYQAVTVISPAIVGGLLGKFGLASFFLFDAATYLVSAYCLLRMRRLGSRLTADAGAPRENGPAPRARTWVSQALSTQFRQLREVARSGSDVLVLLILTFTVVFFCTWAWQIGLVIKSAGISRQGAEIYAAISAVAAAAGILFGLTLPRWLKRPSIPYYLAGSLVWGFGILIAGLAGHSLPVLFTAACLVGIGMTVSTLCRVYVLQTRLPDRLRGRGFASSATLLYIANIASLALFGVLYRIVGLDQIFLIAGLAVIIFSAGCAAIGRHTMLTTTRSSEQPPDDAEEVPASPSGTER